MRELGRSLWANHGPSVSDLPAWIFQNNDWKTRLIELKHYRSGSRRGSGEELVHTEPPLLFNWVEDREFSIAGVTHMFLADSPEYTPAKADELLPIIREYFCRA